MEDDHYASYVKKLDLEKVSESQGNDPGDKSDLEGDVSNEITNPSSKTVSGYLVKTAQNFSTFQRKQFYKRWYELDVETKELKVYETQNGSLKDVSMCSAVVSVATKLCETFRADYQQFFTRGIYHDVQITPPDGFLMPFAVFL